MNNTLKNVKSSNQFWLLTFSKSDFVNAMILLNFESEAFSVHLTILTTAHSNRLLLLKTAYST